MELFALHLDYETRSTVNLKTAGPWVYGEHWSTQVWTASFALGDGDVERWKPGDPVPYTIAKAHRDGVPFVAHNVGFERAITKTQMAVKHGWPIIPLDRWYCSASMCAAMSLPRGLFDAATLMGCDERKDMEGHALMLRMMKPAKTYKCLGCNGTGHNLYKGHGDETCVVCGGHGVILEWHETPEELERGYEYCDQDVRTERSLLKKLRPLPPIEREIWLLDQEMNEIGVKIDKNLVRKAVKIVEKATTELNDQAKFLTGGLLTSQVQKLRWWLAMEGLAVEDLSKDTIKGLLASKNLDALTAQALELRQEAAKSSTAKLKAYIARCCEDEHMKDNLMYHGAGTGRWCLTGDHEVLTPSGWERLDAWQGGPIAVWNPHEEISFQKSRALSFDYTGRLIHHESQRIDQLATPEHHMPSWCTRTGNFEVREAQQLGRWRLPFHGTRKGKSSVSPDELRVLVMVQADGGFTEDGQIRLHFKKRRKIERCKSLLRRAGLVYSMRFERNGCVIFIIAARHLPLYLSMFRDKIFGGWMLDCDPAVFFDELEHWDAYRCGPQSLQYVTTVKANADMVQALAHTSGMAASVTEKKDRKAEWSDAYYVSVWLTPGPYHEVRRNPEEMPFTGRVYCAETPTGFFLVRRNGRAWITGNSGRGAQLQNLPSRFLIGKSQVEAALWMLENDWDGEDMRPFIDTPLETISACLRGMIVADEGEEFIAVDYNAIEARGTAWLALAEALLGVFERGEDPYLFMASQIYDHVDISGVDWTDDKQVVAIKNLYSHERMIGKIACLGLGYQMGWEKFQATCAKDRVLITDQEAQDVVIAYRDGNPEIPDLWAALELAAIEAVSKPNNTFLVAGGKVRFHSTRSWLYMGLPSQRVLSYAHPSIQRREMPWIDERTGRNAMKWGVTFMGVSSLTHKWCRQHAYGGKWCENAVQGLCRDILASAMLRLQSAGYRQRISVHDETVSSVPIGWGSVKEAERIMCALDPWAAGLPVKAEGWRGPRYRK